jgi:hypothetical protein
MDYLLRPADLGQADLEKAGMVRKCVAPGHKPDFVPTSRTSVQP